MLRECSGRRRSPGVLQFVGSPSNPHVRAQPSLLHLRGWIADLREIFLRVVYSNRPRCACLSKPSSRQLEMLRQYAPEVHRLAAPSVLQSTPFCAY
jgi:hypothetical protein